MRWQCQQLGFMSTPASSSCPAASSALAPCDCWDANPCRGILCLPSSGEQSGRGDKRKNSWMTWKPSPLLAPQSRWRWGCSAIYGWDGFLLQALCAVPSLHSLLSLDI